MEFLSQKDKDDLVLLSYTHGCWLDGKPAKLIGRLLDFPIIASSDGTMGIEFSWQAVKRIMDKDRQFSR